MSQRHGTPRLSLDLQQQTVQNAARARAELLHVLAEIAEFPPSVAKLQAWSDALRRITGLPARLQPQLEMLRKAIENALTRESQLRQVWAEYERVLLPGGKAFVSPYASAHCSAELNARVNSECCPFEKGKPCPFGDFYCVNRFGAPCDHLAAGLELASKHLRDLSASGTREQLRRAASRSRKLFRKNLALWIHPIAQALFMKANTPLYQAEALAVDALIRPA
jgi:TorA maturation chaperone TorD